MHIKMIVYFKGSENDQKQVEHGQGGGLALHESVNGSK